MNQVTSGAFRRLPFLHVKIVVRSQPEEGIGQQLARATDTLFGHNFFCS
jgi:hypothetical protein